MSADIEVSVDTTDADAKLNELKIHSTQTARNVVTQSRRAYDTLVLFTTLAGETLDLSYQLMAQGLFTAAETLIALQTITAAATGPGALAFGLFRFTMGATAAAALVTKGFQLQIQGEVTSAELSALIMGANTWRLHA